jgi:predicted MFS family arabinose efflux permease
MMETELKKEVTEIKINEGLLLFILAAINFTHIMDFVIMAPLGPLLKREFLIDTRQSSFLIAVYTLSAGVSGFLATFMIDKFDRRKVLLFMYAGFTFSNLFCALTDSYHYFLIARLVAGVFGGVLGALVMAIVGDAVPYERRGKATGIVMSAFSVASVVGIPLGLFLAAKIQWQMPFIMLTGLGAIIWGTAYFILPSMTGHIKGFSEVPNQGKRNFIKETVLEAGPLLKSLFGNVNIRWAFLFMMMLMIAGLTIVPFLSDYTVYNVGLDQESELPWIYLTGGLATAVSGPLIGKLADRYGKQKVFMVAAILSIIPILIVTNMGKLDLSIVLCFSTMFFIFFGGRFVPAMSMITSSVEPRLRGSFMSINSAMMQVGSFIATFGAGLIIQNGPNGELINYNYVGIFACIATLVCVGISFKVKKVS